MSLTKAKQLKLRVKEHPDSNIITLDDQQKIITRKTLSQRLGTQAICSV